MQLKEDMEKANKTVEKAGAGRDLTAGDLFGVRAIEKGFYGGVSQVDLHAVPTRTMRPGGLTSATSSTIGSPNPTESVISLFNQTGQSASRSNLRLQPSVAEMQRTGQYSPEVDMTATMPPSPTRKSIIETTAPTEPSRLTKPGKSYDPQPARNRNSHKHSSPSTPIMSSTDSLVRSTSPIFDAMTQARRSQSPSTKHPKARQISAESASSTYSTISTINSDSCAPPITLKSVHRTMPQTQSYKPSTKLSQGDQFHHNPTTVAIATTRLRSASIQGRAMNFDTPRRSPFSDLNKSTNGKIHDRDTSVSSSSSSGSGSSSQSAEVGYVNRPGNRTSRYPGMMPLRQDDVQEKGRGRWWKGKRKRTSVVGDEEKRRLIAGIWYKPRISTKDNCK